METLAAFFSTAMRAISLALAMVSYHSVGELLERLIWYIQGVKLPVKLMLSRYLQCGLGFSSCAKLHSLPFRLQIAACRGTFLSWLDGGWLTETATAARR